MTISSTTRVAGPFIGDGTTATFPFTFKVFDADDLYVVTLNLISGAITILALTGGYTAALNADQDVTPGGSITLVAGNLASGLTLAITTDLAELQNVELINAGGFYPDVINAALDRLTILIQQLQIQANSAIRVPFPDQADMELPAAPQRAGKMLMFDDAGNLQLVPIAQGASAVIGSQQATGTVDSINQDFTFLAAAGVTPTPIVYAGGVYQTPTLDYGIPVFVSGTTWKITFTVAPSNGPIAVLLFA